MNAKQLAIIVEAANNVALAAVNIEREVEATSEIGALVNVLYSTADEIRELAEEEAEGS